MSKSNIPDLERSIINAAMRITELHHHPNPNPDLITHSIIRLYDKCDALKAERDAADKVEGKV